MKIPKAPKLDFNFKEAMTNTMEKIRNCKELVPKKGQSSKGGFRLYGDRPMKFPYTFTAKIAQMPWKFHYDTNWYYKYYVFGALGSMPVFAYLMKLSYSPENVQKWKEIKEKEHEEYLHKWD